MLPLLAAALAVAGCSGSGHARASSSTVALANPRNVACDQAIMAQQTGAEGGPVLFGVVGVPPVQLARAVPSGLRSWRFYRKFGLNVRAGGPAVLVSVARTARDAAAIAWGNGPPVSSVRMLSCQLQGVPWSSYAGGFYLHSPTGCVPLVFQAGRQVATVVFAIGRRCG